MYMQEVKKITEEMLDILNRPLPKEALKDHPTKKDSNGKPMTTIKAIYVIDRLNEAFGIGGWILKTDYINHEVVNRVTQANKERKEYVSAVKTTFIVEQYGIHLECVAGSTNDDLGDALKGGTTDGITKIASYLGIGADIWRGEKPKSTTLPTTPGKPAKAKQSADAAKSTSTPAASSAPKGGLTPNTNFDSGSEKPRETEIEKRMKELQPLLDEIKTFEDLTDFNKNHFKPCSDETLRALIAAKIKDVFEKLPAEEQAKKKIKA